jgi:hypothetical protein
VSVVAFTFWQLVPNISERNNSLTVMFDNSNSVRSVSLPVGQYSSENLQAALDPLIPEISIQLNETNSRFVFSCPQPFRLLGSSTMLYLLGFATGADVVSSASGSLVSSDVIRLGGSRFLSISSSLALDTVTNSQMSSSVLARIPIVSDFGMLQQYEAGTPLYARVFDHQLRHLAIRIQDDDNCDVDFQGSKWSLTLYVESVEKRHADLQEIYGSQETKQQEGSDGTQIIPKSQQNGNLIPERSSESR